jgi:hypothetical protein
VPTPQQNPTQNAAIPADVSPVTTGSTVAQNIDQPAPVAAPEAKKPWWKIVGN